MTALGTSLFGGKSFLVSVALALGLASSSDRESGSYLARTKITAGIGVRVQVNHDFWQAKQGFGSRIMLTTAIFLIEEVSVEYLES